MNDLQERARALLSFLKDLGNLRQKRAHEYSDTDSVWWYHELGGAPEGCSSSFLERDDAISPDMWLEVRKKPRPRRPPLPDVVKHWVSNEALDNPHLEPTLRDEIEILVEDRPEEHLLSDHPEAQAAWEQYLERSWKPWAQKDLQWQVTQGIYGKVDFMRRRLEESTESYELVLAVGLVEWRDPDGYPIRRHLLTAPAQIAFNAAQGVLNIEPASSFQRFHVETDMLDPGHRPRLDDTELQDLLEDLDVEASNREKTGRILQWIANQITPEAEVDMSSIHPQELCGEALHVSYAPAIVLRARRLTAYNELIDKLLRSAESSAAVTAPWKWFVQEGPPPSPPESAEGVGEVDLPPLIGSDSRLYFPLPSNEEQKRIVERLQTRPFVLVKGPPGTGKSHTIANLISHLLATGQRVLVTAYATKALAVLQNHLPEQILELCVAALGTSREDQSLLSKSVQRISQKADDWRGLRWAEQETAQLEEELRDLEQRASQLDRSLQEHREAEFKSFQLATGYRGTAAHIARTLEEEKDRHGWLPPLIDVHDRCPLKPEEIAALAKIHIQLDPDFLSEVQYAIGSSDLPNPDEFLRMLEEDRDAARTAQSWLQRAAGLSSDDLSNLWDQTVDRCSQFLETLEELSARLTRLIGAGAQSIMEEMLDGQVGPWEQLHEQLGALVGQLLEAQDRARDAVLDVSAEQQPSAILNDAKRRTEYLRSGGWRGWGFLAPRTARETRYLETCCRLDGQSPREPVQLEVVVACLERDSALKELCQLLPTQEPLDQSRPQHAVAQAKAVYEGLASLVSTFRDVPKDVLAVFPARKRAGLATDSQRQDWLSILRAEAARRRAKKAREPLTRLCTHLRALDSSGDAHPCIGQLLQATEEGDPDVWAAAWEQRRRLLEAHDLLRQYHSLIAKLEPACPGLKSLLASCQGSTEWGSRLADLERAWAWGATRAWLHKVTDARRYEQQLSERRSLQEMIQEQIKKLTAHRAWTAFLSHLDDSTKQDLRAWMDARRRIGKGTGKHAHKHRRDAREYLTRCIQKIPAWIMPLHELWRTTDPEPGAFDTVIIDEASQAGLDALALLLMGKRVIVVGDEWQNSPEAVGLKESGIEQIARRHLKAFRYLSEFRPDMSLYNHAKRSFLNEVSLREHFRCVREIIRFSNDLCYSDTPLIPLREPPPVRLEPLKPVLVDAAICEGRGSRLTNSVEADEVVRAIETCTADSSYDGKTMGVIALQGFEQARLIEKKLTEVLGPEEIERRRLRCGTAATFQGDERDVVFLSLVVAPNHRFRALTSLPDQKRYNVAMSRARDQVWLFHSLKLNELSPQDLRWQLVDFFYGASRKDSAELYENMERLERESARVRRELGNQPDPFDSWFEVDVALELMRRSYQVRPQYEISDYRIDLMVEGVGSRLAVECDGDEWHGPDQWSRDMQRQRLLERAARLRFVRIRESEFYTDRDAAIQRVVVACQDLGISPIGHPDEQEADAPAELVSDEGVGAASAPVEEDASSGDLPAQEQPPTAQRAKKRVKREKDPKSEKRESISDARAAPESGVRAALRNVIEEEGPLTKRLLFKLFREHGDGGHNLRSTELNRVLSSLQKSRDIHVVDTLGDRTMESQVVYMKDGPAVSPRAAGQRDLLDIPPSEIFHLLDTTGLAQDAASQADADIYAEILRHYGFDDLSAPRSVYLSRILRAYRAQQT